MFTHLGQHITVPENINPEPVFPVLLQDSSPLEVLVGQIVAKAVSLELVGAKAVPVVPVLDGLVLKSK